MKNKQDIILLYIRDGKSQRQIHKETGLSRDTIRKYLTEYENNLLELGKIKEGEDIRKVDIIENISNTPKYNSSERIKKVLTDEVLERIKYYLKENQEKRLKGMSKQQKRKKDIYEALVKEGFNISYPSVVNAINNIEISAKEAYIRQEYDKGEVAEFDWGTVKLKTEGGMIREYQMAVFTSAYSNLRWARLYLKQNTACFLEAHAQYFDEIKGVYKTIVYDNTKVAVKKFVGHTEKEATDELLKLSIYYRFYYRFCNAYCGNEKGHVERSVDFIRHKAFSHKDTFESIEEANEYLKNICIEINNIRNKQTNKAAQELFEEEKEYLLPRMPKYETAVMEDHRVDKYSTVIIDGSRYSVPDIYVNKMVRCKIYSSRIFICYNGEKVAEHIKSPKLNEWKIDIEHYTRTLFRKPHALINSVALKQLDYRLKLIYEKHFKAREKEYIELIILVGEVGIDIIEKTIENLVNKIPTIDITLDKIKYIINLKEDDVYTKEYYNSLSSEIIKNSIEMLNNYEKMLYQ